MRRWIWVLPRGTILSSWEVVSGTQIRSLDHILRLYAMIGGGGL